MNEQMRRYLDEEALDELEIREATAARERRSDDRPPPDPRRQKSKEWGRAMAKFQRAQQKDKKR